jgi:hypothetical protein
MIRFRWLECQLTILNKLCTERDVRDALAVLPQTLFESYDRLLISIDERHAELIRKALALIVHARKKLNLEQVIEAIAPINEEGYIDWSATFMDPRLLLRECRALLTLDDGDDDGDGIRTDINVQFCHYTVRVSPCES